MSTYLIIIGNAILAYAVDIALIGLAGAYFTLRRGKPFSWYTAVPIFLLFFAFNDLYVVPFLVHLDATFTIQNPAIVEALGTSANESLTNFILSDAFDFFGWLVQAILAFGLSFFLTRGLANHAIKADEN